MMVLLGSDVFSATLAMMTEAAVSGGVLNREMIERHRGFFPARAGADLPKGQQRAATGESVEDALQVLQRGWYLAPWDDGHRFASGLLEDSWRMRHGRHFVPVGQRLGAKGA